MLPFFSGKFLLCRAFGTLVCTYYLKHSAHFSLPATLQLFLVGQSSFWIKTVQEYGLGWVLFPALLVIVNDTMAYVFGVLMGKHKLIPKLSPKKTVEGFVGAGLSTVIVASPLVKRCISNDIPNLGRHAVILGMLVLFHRLVAFLPVP